jgi:hypothetical protein
LRKTFAHFAVKAFNVQFFTHGVLNSLATWREKAAVYFTQRRKGKKAQSL